MAKMESGAKRELIAVQNRKARHDYEVMGPLRDWHCPARHRGQVAARWAR